MNPSRSPGRKRGGKKWEFNHDCRCRSPGRSAQPLPLQSIRRGMSGVASRRHGCKGLSASRLFASIGVHNPWSTHLLNLSHWLGLGGGPIQQEVGHNGGDGPVQAHAKLLPDPSCCPSH
ncbi:hypothetical protein HPP92_017584 [Vanilla planifolia]|uniref:Uncharacterized protein n=1 Tax=Vanilla planifolia TaxID=51239 RepID=A0A835QCH6_VANPL|nr:hypothetical protein HPP92_017584 [Vanilla planifolia]